MDDLFAEVLDEGCENFKAEMVQAIKEVMNKLNAILRNDPQVLVCNTYKECFPDNLGHYETEIARLVDQLLESLLTDFREIHQKAAIHGTGHYFTVSMHDIYENCDSERPLTKGKTLHKCRTELFEAGACDPNGPFRGIPEGVEVSMIQALNQNGGVLQTTF
ncbi:uncharacterized protein BDR25DRAFT_367665 [Lindgomyces ingoldianus]|uniref:Uncharacterized protein n=1 Tax=Lindgomyces ingoldianus TaxID=673940 RepID=A0ACB6R0E6_9PLEO|nr:uncharacterized protein BDR25DRAFT_367665 [Lindgomyces ingoldianus]KAF2471802.1 hypothetical protein BDR25DRAFT_367665 [Lindgomyces ingoldianus]